MSAQQLHVVLAGRERAMDAGTTAAQALDTPDVTPRAPNVTAVTVIAARINGELRDLATPLVDGDHVEPVEIGSDDGRAILRHSTSGVGIRRSPAR